MNFLAERNFSRAYVSYMYVLLFMLHYRRSDHNVNQDIISKTLRSTEVKLIRIIAALVILLLASTPAIAETPGQYMDKEVEEWTDIALKNGFNILETYRDEIGADSVTYTLELAPGVYHLYFSGGMNVEDLDVYIYSPDGYTLTSDTLPDKIPITVIMLDEPASVDVEITAWSFTSSHSDGLYCLLVTCEDEGEILSMSIKDDE